MAKGLSKPQTIVNNQPVAILANTLKYTEGEGETTVRATSTGGGGIELVITDDAEQKISDVSFELANTAENIKLARGWKKNPGVNTIRFSDEGLNRVCPQASIANNYEVELSTEGKLSLEWKTAQVQ